MGVVSGVVMSYQFGTNWNAFADQVGPVIGPVRGYEVMTAFFLEAGFLGVTLFGVNRVGRGLHYVAMWMATVVAPLQVIAGDLHGLNTLEHQPAKIAAMEGLYETQRGAPFIVLGWPDSAAEEVRHALQILKLGSLILKHRPNAGVTGLDAWPRENWTNVPLVFWSFRVMLAAGIGMTAIDVWSLVQRVRRRLSAHLRRRHVLSAAAHEPEPGRDGTATHAAGRGDTRCAHLPRRRPPSRP